jgi:hypothetical protein
MTPQGTLVALVCIGILMLLVLRLTIRGRLYVGYSAIWFTCLAAGALLLILPPLLQFLTRAVGAVFPVSAVTLLALLFIFLVLIYFSYQLTILGDRITNIAQHIALREVRGLPASHDVDSKAGPVFESKSE